MGECVNSSKRRSRRRDWSSKSSRPPPYPRNGNGGVPWEIRFYTSEFGITREQLSCAQVSLSIFKNVADWDDSAALEALNNSKSRYWAKINRLPCNVPLPDPDMYIDKVDYDVVIDPELIEDLYRFEEPSICMEDPERKGWNSLSLASNPIVPTGWGDEDDPAETGNNSYRVKPSNWDSLIERQIQESGWGTLNWSNVAGPGNNSWDDANNGLWRPWSNLNDEPVPTYGRKRDRVRFGSRQSKPRRMEDEDQKNNNWTKFGGINSSYRAANERCDFNRAAQDHDPAGHCAPLFRQGSTENSSGSCHWKRHVSY